MRININKNNLLDIINIKFDVFNPINSFMSKENFFPLKFCWVFFFFKEEQMLSNVEITVSTPTIPPPIDIWEKYIIILL